MNKKIDRFIHTAFEQMVNEAGDDPCTTQTILRPLHARKNNSFFSLGFIAAVFLVFVFVPPFAIRGKTSFADHAAGLASNPDLVHYAELLVRSRIK